MKLYEIEFSYQASGVVTVAADSKENAEEVFRDMDFDGVIDGSGALVSPAEMDIDGIEEVEPDDD